MFNALLDVIATPFGWVMYGIYHLLKDYGIAIVLFTLIIKILMFPTAYNQQKNMARMQAINPKLAKLKKSFANNPQRMQEEQAKLYQEEGINPMASCAPSLLTMVIVMGLYRVVSNPLTHILHLKDQVSSAKTLLETYLTDNNLETALKYFNARPELSIMDYAKSNPDIFSGLSGFTDKVNSFENSLFGFIDLGAIPSMHAPDGGWTSTALALAAIPFLSGIIQLILTVYSQRRQKAMNPDTPSMGGMMAMLYIMPVFSVVFAFQVPAALGFYWVISSLFSLLQTICLYQYFTPERAERIAEQEKEKSKKKKPGMMQRMMEKQQEMLAQQAGETKSGTTPMTRSSGNRVQYSDETVNMTRSELQEYNRQRINEARKRMAEKYGDDNGKND